MATAIFIITHEVITILLSIYYSNNNNCYLFYYTIIILMLFLSFSCLQNQAQNVNDNKSFIEILIFETRGKTKLYSAYFILCNTWKYFAAGGEATHTPTHTLWSRSVFVYFHVQGGGMVAVTLLSFARWEPSRQVAPRVSSRYYFAIIIHEHPTSVIIKPRV